MVTKRSSKRRGAFKGKVSRNAVKQSKNAQYKHLNLPKGMRIFKEEPKSRVSLDILPYEVTNPHHLDRDEEYETALVGGLWYRHPYWIHRNIGANNESVVCPSSVKQKCPICEHRAQLLKDGVEWNDDSVKALKASLRNLYVVIPRGSKNYEETPHIWDISQFLFQDKLNEEIQENEEYETFPDLEDGYTLRIRFTEEQIGTNKFAATSRIDFIERDKPLAESLLEDVPALDDILVVPTYKTVEALFFGGLTQDEIDDEDEDEKPRRKPKHITSADDEEDEEEEKPEPRRKPKPDDDEEEEEEEDEKPEPRSKPKAKPKPKPEEEEEEEEEAPKNPTPTRTTKTKDAAKGCPHGGKFGKDFEELDECAACKTWEACADASEA